MIHDYNGVKLSFSLLNCRAVSIHQPHPYSLLLSSMEDADKSSCSLKQPEDKGDEVSIVRP